MNNKGSLIINSVLAFIPFVIALYLFKLRQSRSFIWWLLATIFIVFLPNAAYVLTDIIHFIAAYNSPTISREMFWLAILPFYLIFISLNFQFYVISVTWAYSYLLKKNINNSNLNRLFIPATHLLSALGVYLGRFQRLESDNIIHQPIIVFRDALKDITHENTLLIIILLSLIIGGFYLFFNRINLALSKKYQTYQCNIN